LLLPKLNPTGNKKMKFYLFAIILLLTACLSTASAADNDTREQVKFPEMMQQHMLSNMRDHLVVINEILIYLATDEMDKAADIAENRLGMSAMNLHGAGRQAQFMPDGMKSIGSGMHRAASRFARKSEEGDPAPAYKALQEVTAACVACHAAYRVN
jgi:hypothetical protein